MPPPVRSAYMLKLKSGNETTRFAPRARRYYNKAGLHATVAAICRPHFSARKHRNAIRTSLYCGTRFLAEKLVFGHTCHDLFAQQIFMLQKVEVTSTFCNMET